MIFRDKGSLEAIKACTDQTVIVIDDAAEELMPRLRNSDRRPEVIIGFKSGGIGDSYEYRFGRAWFWYGLITPVITMNSPDITQYAGCLF